MKLTSVQGTFQMVHLTYLGRQGQMVPPVTMTSRLDGLGWFRYMKGPLQTRRRTFADLGRITAHLGRATCRGRMPRRSRTSPPPGSRAGAGRPAPRSRRSRGPGRGPRRWLRHTRPTRKGLPSGSLRIRTTTSRWHPQENASGLSKPLYQVPFSSFPSPCSSWGTRSSWQWRVSTKELMSATHWAFQVQCGQLQMLGLEHLTSSHLLNRFLVLCSSSRSSSRVLHCARISASPHGTCSI
mmetsp:Transcript_74987/g.195011  ORF Transcript_74987/g.195011 Transcript_74987/m.195011 type:complete len:239 (-) Transcript_74987:1105-1821(-)